MQYRTCFCVSTRAYLVGEDIYDLRRLLPLDREGNFPEFARAFP
jgi:hypothetical protein